MTAPQWAPRRLSRDAFIKPAGRICKRDSEEMTYLCERSLVGVRASGLFDDQSSGGKATRQKFGLGAENSTPISALPLRTGPRNATWHSCSSSVLLCLMLITAPLITRALSKTRAPCALIARVSVIS